VEYRTSTLHPVCLEGNTQCLVMFGRSFGSRYTTFVHKQGIITTTSVHSRSCASAFPLRPSPSGDESAIQPTVSYHLNCAFLVLYVCFHCDSVCNVLNSWRTCCKSKALGSSWRNEERSTTEAPTADSCQL
jgi:hypothetical protein